MASGGQFVLSPDSNHVLTAVNDHVVRISTMTQPYFWHRHADSDETFLVVEGILIVDESRRIVS